MADAPLTPCPKCGAPCTTKVEMRGGDHGWGTTDAERTTYRWAPPSPPVAAQAEPDWWRPHASKIEDRVAASGSTEAMACFTDMRTLMQEVARPQPPRPGTAPLSDEQIIRAAVAAMPHTNPGVADDLLGGFTMHTEAEDIVAIWKAAAGHPTTPTPKD